MTGAVSRDPATGLRGEAVPRTPVAVLGTLAEFHREPIPYDLAALVGLVVEQHPELLCLDMTPEQWRDRDFEDLPPEYREALLPLAGRTDIVVVPVAGERAPEEPSANGWRGRAIAVLRRMLVYLQRTAPGPAAVSEGPRHLVADGLYAAIVSLAGGAARRAWREHTNGLVDRVRETVRRDPESRVLVAVNVRHCHHVRRGLSKCPEIEVVSYEKLRGGLRSHG